MHLDAHPDLVHLQSAGLSLVVRTGAGQTSEVLYWGEGLGVASARTVRSLSAAFDESYDGNMTNDPLRVGIIPLASAGWMGRPGLVGHRDGGTNWAPRLRVAGVEIDAEDVVVDGDVLSAGAGSLRLTLSDPACGLEVLVTIELTAHGLARARARLTNTVDAAYHLEELSLALPLPLDADEILDFSGRWGREREPQRHSVELGTWLREGRHGRTGFDAPMMTFCGPAGFDFRGGRVWGLHIAFSGNHRTWVERCINGRQVIAGGELLLPGEVSLARDESYESPWIYFATGDGLDDVARQVHSWLRARPDHPDAERPVSLNVWEAVYFDHDLPKLKKLADKAASLGVERYVLDDGWFHLRRDDTAGLGDWFVDPDVWPEGLAPLVDHVRGLGMQFGLWVEPEMVNPDSDVARAHPEWIMSAGAVGDALPMEWRTQQVINLAVPEAYEHVRGQLDALLTKYEIAYLKWDHNRDLIDAGTQSLGGRASVHDHTLACYRLMDELRAAHPGLEIESCSSGGARVDLEVALHTQRFWLSDCIDPHERYGIVRWSEQLLPPEMMGTHVASDRSHTTGRRHDLSFRAASAILGHFGIEWDISDLSDDESTQLAEWIAFYKVNRGFLNSGLLVRDDVTDGSLWLHGIVAPDLTRGLYELVTRERSPMSPRGRVLLPGLDDDTEYEVRPVLVGGGPKGLQPTPWMRDGVVLSGRALRLSGLAIPLIFPEQALLIEATAVTG